jgi:NAD+ diphosphatase
MKYCPKCSALLISKEFEQRTRLVCSSSSCDYVFWNNPVPVVAMIVETNEGIVLARSKHWPAGVFSVITGFLESGESPQEAAQRETKEELGLDTHEVNFIGVFPFHRLNQLMVAFHLKTTGTITLNDELDEFKIVAREQLLGYRETGKFEVERWLNGRNVMETGF